ncbi:MAG: hypothetical protein NZR01_06190 [Bryobacteraceae bacterium]|nr:hypothetical protein [Bryobacteraceae bacterium]
MHLTFAFVALCAAAPAVSAQYRLAADIPFAFTVGDQPCPAGKWVIQQSASNPALLTLKSGDGKHSFMVLTGSVIRPDATGPGQLMFNQYGGERFLHQVWPFGRTGSELRPGVPEQKLLAMHGAPEKTALVIAGSR